MYIGLLLVESMDMGRKLHAVGAHAWGRGVWRTEAERWQELGKRQL